MIHSVRTHKEGRGSNKAYAMRTRREGAHTWKYVRNNVPFCTYFAMFSYAGSFYHTSLSFVVDFHYGFIKRLLRLFSCLSNALKSISLWNYLLDI